MSFSLTTNHSYFHSQNFWKELSAFAVSISLYLHISLVSGLIINFLKHLLLRSPVSIFHLHPPRSLLECSKHLIKFLRYFLTSIFIILCFLFLVFFRLLLTTWQLLYVVFLLTFLFPFVFFNLELSKMLALWTLIFSSQVSFKTTLTNYHKT